MWVMDNRFLVFSKCCTNWFLLKNKHLILSRFGIKIRNQQCWGAHSYFAYPIYFVNSSKKRLSGDQYKIIARLKSDKLRNVLNHSVYFWKNQLCLLFAVVIQLALIWTKKNRMYRWVTAKQLQFDVIVIL